MKSRAVDEVSQVALVVGVLGASRNAAQRL